MLIPITSPDSDSPVYINPAFIVIIDEIPDDGSEITFSVPVSYEEPENFKTPQSYSIRCLETPEQLALLVNAHPPPCPCPDSKKLNP